MADTTLTKADLIEVSTAEAATEADSDHPATVRLPAGLTARAGGQRIFVVTGATLQDVVDALDRACPGLRFDLCQETGDLRQYVNVFVGGRNVRHLQGLSTPIPSGATIHVLPSVAGG